MCRRYKTLYLSLCRRYIFSVSRTALCSGNVHRRSNLVEDDEERSEARGDELDADAEGDNELVRGDGEEEVPDVGGLKEARRYYWFLRKSCDIMTLLIMQLRFVHQCIFLFFLLRRDTNSRLLREADGHALEDGVQGESEYYQESAQGHLKHNRINE